MIDWLNIYQDFDFILPTLGKKGMVPIDLETGEISQVVWSPSFQHEGSHCTKISIKTHGHRLAVSGNPSRYNRLDNVFGYQSIDECILVYNRILRRLGLPQFSRATKLEYRQVGDMEKPQKVTDGAVITRVDLTTNRTVGESNETDYIKAISSCHYRNSAGYVYPNVRTADWKNRTTGKVSSLLYAKCYDKGFSLQKTTLPEIIKRYGKESKEVAFLDRVIKYCNAVGMVRFESSFKTNFLRRNNCRFFGFHDFNNLIKEHERFLNIDSRLQVTAMDYEHIAERLISQHIVESTRSANITALYAVQWMHGQVFDLNKTQVKLHRARLRKIGIDIANPCNIQNFSPIFLKKAKTIEVGEATPPDWYSVPEIETRKLRLVS